MANNKELTLELTLALAHTRSRVRSRARVSVRLTAATLWQQQSLHPLQTLDNQTPKTLL